MFTSTDQALHALLPYASDKTNPLWEASLLSISKDLDQEYLIELSGFYYDSPEDKQLSSSFQREMPIEFKPLFQEVYEYLQAHFARVNPNSEWNTLVMEVRDDGSYTAHYELDGDEVSPDAPPMPETITASYLCENLQNCLSHKAPDNYQWVWEVLERKHTEDGKIQIGGKFYYSLNKDQSDPKPLEPGEYVYMYNVSEQLFDEFYADTTRGWTKIGLAFTSERKVYIKVLSREP